MIQTKNKKQSKQRLGRLRSYTATPDIIDDFSFRIARKSRYTLKSLIKKFDLTTSKSVRECGLHPMPSSVTGEACETHIKMDGDKAYATNLMFCKSVWACPTCRYRIISERSDELDKVVNTWNQSGKTLMLTLTMPHNLSQSLSDVVGDTKEKRGLLGAWSMFSNGRPFKRIKDKYKIEGYVRALETTYGKNGWHGHFHILMFLDKKTVKIEDMKKDFYQLWSHSVNSVCGVLPSIRNGSDLRESNAGWYLSKWNIAKEVSNGSTKNAKNGSYSIADIENVLLGKNDNLEYDKACLLLKEFYSFFNGKKQLQWSASKKLKELRQEKTEDEILNGGELIGYVDACEWYKITAISHGICEFLESIEKFGFLGGQDYMLRKGLNPNCFYPSD